MSERDRQYAIQIGDDAWIDFIDLDGRYDQAIDIDALLGELWPLICRLETHCAAGCCGMDAFDFTQAGIAAALLELDRAQLHAACAQARSAVAAAASDVFMSNTMNHMADKRVFLQLLAHIDRCIVGP
ncbi:MULTISPECIES: DUF6331 family protein [unclassified Janthinobacterium]|uniref:DUF6331 family protein n=1 Tax=unclassified Janthinobacterium TaxID=2610881 RepID=UPI00088FD432|nr:MULTISPECIES: DUF6331 family protein [unclassified Janthinobacterium]SDA56426.1 hypothetical protein SAMN03159349_01980 [Janthinobacterium sp. 551a]SFB48412.1 hypothetical protein SAMN03159300_105333 [Janthinobacterium sp. 344]